MAIWGNVFSFLKMCVKGMASEREIWKEENYWSSVMKKSCALQTKTRILIIREKEKKHSSGGCQIEINFVLV